MILDIYRSRNFVTDADCFHVTTGGEGREGEGGRERRIISLIAGVGSRAEICVDWFSH